MFQKIAQEIADIATELDNVGEQHAAQIVDDLLLDISHMGASFDGANSDFEPELAPNETLLFTIENDNGIFDIISLNALNKHIADGLIKKSDVIKAASAHAYSKKDVDGMVKIASSFNKFDDAIDYLLKSV